MLRILFAIISCFHTLVNSADFNDQQQFNKFCCETARTYFEDINKSIRFSSHLTTNSKHWEVVKILENPFFVKRRGVPLSAALIDLTKESNSDFDCASALMILTWKILLQFEETDGIISYYEQRDKDFFLPLMNFPVLITIMDYATSHDFSNRQGLFKEDGVEVNPQEELKKIDQFKTCLRKLLKLLACISPCNNESKPPYKTCLGGAYYLPNVQGVFSSARGENLICVDEVRGLYFGFGPLFKDGPKTLMQIGDSLKVSAQKGFPGLYEKNIEPYLKECQVGHHPLEYLVPSHGCVYYDMKKIKANLKAALNFCNFCDDVGATCTCSICQVHYCGKKCQSQDWPAHKLTCKKKS